MFIKKETLAQMFSCEFCEISDNTFFIRTPLEAVSGNGSTAFNFMDEDFLRNCEHFLQGPIEISVLEILKYE